MHSNLGRDAGSAAANPTRTTALISISNRMSELNDRVSLANQKIEGILHRAGLPIPPQTEPNAAHHGDAIQSTDFQLIEGAISVAFSQVSELETLGDALSYLA